MTRDADGLEVQPPMKVISVHVGLPRTVSWKGRPVSTGIFKEPVAHRVALRSLNFEGDGQADLSVHGGRDKAVYLYPMEHYAYWRREYPDMILPWGMFGENLTIEGLLEDAVNVGDRLQIGSSKLIVTQPRMPCYKLGLRFGRDDVIKRFLNSARTGFYGAVLKEGEVGAGDPITLIERAAEVVPVAEITRLYARDRTDVAALTRIARVAALPGDWRDYFIDQLSRLTARAPQSDASAPAPAWSGFRPFTLKEKVRENDSVASFYLVPEDGQPVPSYLPGQFLTVRPRMLEAKSPPVRSYSLSDTSSPDHYRITIKRIGPRAGEPQAASGLVSSYFHDRLTVGDGLDVKAPAGNFTIDIEAHDQPLVLVGGGIGVTPLLSMLQSIVTEGSSRETWLFHGVRDERDHVMRARLEEIARQHSNVHLHFFYSQPARATDGDGVHVGHIDLAAMQRLLPSNQYYFYVCGPPAMMDAITQGLDVWGVPAERVRFEAFGPATVKRAVHGPATQPDCGIEVTFARSGVTTLWNRCDAPLLELAEEHAVAIEFGCRAGSCGTCVTRVLSGAVRYLHAPNAPLGAGEALPCIAIPAGPLVLDV
jgi:ferredoxin-NADP reductase/MOSC domain-containing protein YiiM